MCYTFPHVWPPKQCLFRGKDLEMVRPDVLHLLAAVHFNLRTVARGYFSAVFFATEAENYFCIVCLAHRMQPIKKTKCTRRAQLHWGASVEYATYKMSHLHPFLSATLGVLVYVLFLVIIWIVTRPHSPDLLAQNPFPHPPALPLLPRTPPRAGHLLPHYHCRA